MATIRIIGPDKPATFFQAGDPHDDHVVLNRHVCHEDTTDKEPYPNYGLRDLRRPIPKSEP